MTHAPRSLPRYFAKSASLSICAYTTVPTFGPLVLSDHALGYAMIGYLVGSSTCAEKRSLSHPRPNGPHGSRRGLVMPHDFIWATVQSPAFLRLGDPVSRGP